ncbi:hypothetical protein [Maribacter sp. 2308TA10-17]
MDELKFLVFSLTIVALVSCGTKILKKGSLANTEWQTLFNDKDLEG